MNFDFSPEQQQFREQLRRMLKKADGLGQGRSILEGQCESHSTSIWQGLAELGVQAAAIPEKYAGLGLGPLELCVAAEEIGRVLAPVPFLSSIGICAEAIRLGKLLAALLPGRAEPRGLLALMLLHDSRRETRQDAEGTLVRLEDQDRGRWDRAPIAQGTALVEEALRAGPPGPYALQAAIAALHARAPRATDTDWPQIAALYGVLYGIQPSPVVELNRAVAIAMADGLERGLELIDRLEARGDLTRYHLVDAARADLLRRLGRRAEANAAYARAIDLATNEAERRFLRWQMTAGGPREGRGG